MAVLEWENVCPGSTEILQNLAQAKDDKFEEDLWRDTDSPNRTVTWQRNGINYSISMITNQSVDIWAGAWKDNSVPHVRKSLTPFIRSLTTPVTPDLFQKTINELLKEVGPKVGLLNLRNHPTGVVISPITPRLMNI